MRTIEPRKTSCYCMNFRRMANTLTKFYNSKLAAADLTANQLSLLSDIKSIQPCNRSELARCARLDRTTVIRNLKPLREKGLIEENQQDSSICLSPLGFQAVESGYRIWVQAQEEINGLFDAESRSALYAAFARIDEMESLI